MTKQLRSIQRPQIAIVQRIDGLWQVWQWRDNSESTVRTFIVRGVANPYGYWHALPATYGTRKEAEKMARISAEIEQKLAGKKGVRG